MDRSTQTNNFYLDETYVVKTSSVSLYLDETFGQNKQCILIHVYTGCSQRQFNMAQTKFEDIKNLRAEFEMKEIVAMSSSLKIWCKHFGVKNKLYSCRCD